jgi:hypothetical protein
MGAVKHYLLNLVCEGQNAFAQEAIEHAILTGVFKPSGDLQHDKQTIAQMYDLICDTYRTSLTVRETGYFQASLHLPGASVKRRPARTGASEALAVRVGA